MEVVYAFCEPDAVRIPFYDYDRNLFQRLVTQGGAWDKELRQFVFTRKISAEQFNQILSGVPGNPVPFVWVEENTSVPARVYDFCECPTESLAEKPPSPSIVCSAEAFKNHLRRFRQRILPSSLQDSKKTKTTQRLQ